MVNMERQMATERFVEIRSALRVQPKCGDSEFYDLTSELLERSKKEKSDFGFGKPKGSLYAIAYNIEVCLKPRERTNFLMALFRRAESRELGFIISERGSDQLCGMGFTTMGYGLSWASAKTNLSPDLFRHLIDYAQENGTQRTAVLAFAPVSERDACHKRGRRKMYRKTWRIRLLRAK